MANSSKSRPAIEKINALAELQSAGIKYDMAGENEVQLRCPVHEKDDGEGRVGLNVVKNLWRCRSAGCDAHGDIIGLLALYLGVERQVALIDLSKRYDLETIKELPPALVEKYHERIWNAGPLLAELSKRGITENEIREMRLGEHDGKITIPIYDEENRVVNIRRYLPGAPGKLKMANTAGYGGIKLFQPNDCKYDRIWICGGEMKARVAKTRLNPAGIGAIACSAGEGNWDEKFDEKISGKVVYICLDIDEGGRAGSRILASQIFYAALAVYIIRLPLDPKTYPKGDLNDYVANFNVTTDTLLELMVSAERFSPNNVEIFESDQPPKRVRLSDAISASNIGLAIEVEAVVAAIDTNPYLVPKTVGILCSRDQPNCPYCPVKLKEQNPDTGYTKLTIKGSANGILEMVRTAKSHQSEAIRESLRIPRCKVAKFHAYDFFNVVDVRLSPQLHIGVESSESIQPVPALVVDSQLDLNTPYLLRGRVYPHPKDQQAVLLLENAVPVDDNLSTFSPSDADLSDLSIFRPCENSVENISAKLDEIYVDLEANVTRIFNRRDLHLIIDLTYHSVLLFEFDNQITKGWLNALIIGDSAQGKSESSSRLRDHYCLGERVECKNLSKAGLLGGVIALGNRWFVSWGVIPKHDRRLVILEEVKGAAMDVVAGLTDMRSSGIAEITKVEARKTSARTRLLFISNPRGDRVVAQYNFGIETIKELIGAPEDIRRFDAALLVSAAEINPAEINRLSRERPVVPHRFKSDLCRRLVLWSWTRRPEQIRFEDDALTEILSSATELCTEFTESLPLVDRGTMRHKLARLSAALAARLFSTDGDDNRKLVVRRCHVQFLVSYLRRIYGSSTMGYRDFSIAQIYHNNILDPQQVCAEIAGTKHPTDFVKAMLNNDEISLGDIGDWIEEDRIEGQRILSVLVRKHALYRSKANSRCYVKTSKFIALLKELEARGFVKDAEPIRKEEF